MARRPPPDHGIALDSAAAIVDRRTRHKGPGLAELDDSLDGVVDHVANHSRHLPPHLVREDVVDALSILDYLDHESRTHLARQRLKVLEAALAAGMTNRELMGPLHQKHTQGIPQTVGRLRALLDPQVGIADARRGRRAAAARKNERAQIVDRAAPIIAFGRGLLARRHLVPDTPLESDLPFEFAYLLMLVEQRLPGGVYESLDGLTAALRMLVRHLTDFPEIDPELHAVLVHGAQSLPPAPTKPAAS